MSKSRHGFTLIEVALFLAVTAALFVGVTVGVQNSIFQQRYNDSVQNFVEFLRRAYSGVSNVQNVQVIDRGRTEKAIYGKLITFGESRDLAGEAVNGDGQKNSIFVYDVIGDIGDIESGNVLEALNELHANVVTMNEGRAELVGAVEDYTPKWAAQIEGPCVEKECNYNALRGMLLIVRHPRSGTVYTYYSDEVININERIMNYNSQVAAGIDVNKINIFQEGERNYLTDGSFSTKRVDFCVNPNGDERSRLRRDVRIVMGARNASGIETVAEDSDSNACVGR